MSIFQELNDQGLTVMLVTHESDIAEHARRTVFFKDGVVLSDRMVQKRRIARLQLAAASEAAG
jgi:putative ABC transport system ATP-binding protein